MNFCGLPFESWSDYTISANTSPKSALTDLGEVGGGVFPACRIVTYMLRNRMASRYAQPCAPMSYHRNLHTRDKSCIIRCDPNRGSLGRGEASGGDVCTLDDSALRMLRPYDVHPEMLFTWLRILFQGAAREPPLKYVNPSAARNLVFFAIPFAVFGWV